jgi:hypothetical protein
MPNQRTTKGKSAIFGMRVGEATRGSIRASALTETAAPFAPQIPQASDPLIECRLGDHDRVQRIPKPLLTPVCDEPDFGAAAGKVE